jgi:hypothetical protein
MSQSSLAANLLATARNLLRNEIAKISAPHLAEIAETTP